MKIRSCLMAAGFAAFLPMLSAHAAGAFECPAPDAGATPDAAIAALLPPPDGFDDVTKLNASVSAMAAQGASRAAIIDILVSRYCPLLAGEDQLSDAAKAERMRAFASRVTRTVFGLEDEDTVIFDVPLLPVIANVVTAKASAEKMTPGAWIASLVGKSLGN